MIGRRRRILRSGMSLVELVIVLLVIAILAAAAVSRYSTALNQYRAENAARIVAADLQYAASAAQRLSQTKQVQFDVPGNSYTLNGLDDLDLDGVYYTVDFDDPQYEAAISSADFDGNFIVTFDMYGRPDNTGSVVLQSGSATQTVTLNADGTTTLP